MQSIETWRPIPDYEGYYEVSDLGRIRSMGRHYVRRGYPVIVRERIMKPHLRDGGYHIYDLRVDGVRTKVSAHRAVASAFLGDITGLVVRHKDDDPGNNRLSNLEIGTQKDNMNDASVRGRINPWNRGKTHCKNGHEFTEENTRYGKKRERICITCNRAYQRMQHARQRAAQAENVE